MKELIDWLITIESKAASVYEKAADFFSDNEELADFVRDLAMDEEKHIDYFCKASELIENKRSNPFNVSMDKDAIDATEILLSLCEKRIDANSFTKENLIDCIASIEYSEYNKICLNVISILIKDFREFIPAAVNIQKHIKKIERFIKSDPELYVFLDRIRKLPTVWQEKLLVVDDDVIIRGLLTEILRDEGVIETTTDGEEALKKIHEKYYATIITDVDMPRMNGIELYKKAFEMFPAIKERFLFFTGALDDELESFFIESNLRYLKKPSEHVDKKNPASTLIQVNKPYNTKTWHKGMQ
jgi:two-component system chemotaxis response regulator CheY